MRARATLLLGMSLLVGAVTLLSLARAGAEESPLALNLCAINNANEEPAPSDFRSPSPSPATPFRPAANGCGNVFDSIFAGGRWGRVASTTLEASRLMLGVDLDVKKFIEFARHLGVAPRGEPRPSASTAANGSDQFEIATHHSFFLRASRKEFLLGFKLQW